MIKRMAMQSSLDRSSLHKDHLPMMHFRSSADPTITTPPRSTATAPCLMQSELRTTDEGLTVGGSQACRLSRQEAVLACVSVSRSRSRSLSVRSFCVIEVMQGSALHGYRRGTARKRPLPSPLLAPTEIGDATPRPPFDGFPRRSIALFISVHSALSQSHSGAGVFSAASAELPMLGLPAEACSTSTPVLVLVAPSSSEPIHHSRFLKDTQAQSDEAAADESQSQTSLRRLNDGRACTDRRVHRRLGGATRRGKATRSDVRSNVLNMFFSPHPRLSEQRTPNGQPPTATGRLRALYNSVLRRSSVSLLSSSPDVGCSVSEPLHLALGLPLRPLVPPSPLAPKSIRSSFGKRPGGFDDLRTIAFGRRNYWLNRGGCLLNLHLARGASWLPLRTTRVAGVRWRAGRGCHWGTTQMMLALAFFRSWRCRYGRDQLAADASSRFLPLLNCCANALQNLYLYSESPRPPNSIRHQIQTPTNHNPLPFPAFLHSHLNCFCHRITRTRRDDIDPVCGER